MRQLPIVFASLILVSACTQPAVPVEMRGGQDFSKNADGYSKNVTIAGVQQTVHSSSPAYVGATPVYNASREQESQIAANTPTQQTAPVSDIAVNDLQPAPKEEKKPAPIVLAHEAAPAAAPAKTTATALNEPVPSNPWTKKPRDASAFTTSEASPAAGNPSYIWPVASHKVKTGFSDKVGGKANDGINIASTEGEPVWAAADGEVIYADSKMKGYGNMVIVKHAGNKTTTYAHLARSSVEKYDRVKQGDILGYVGTTGSVKSPQLYFSMRDGTTAIDPQKYLDHKMAGL